jgi:hypothetical protein
MPTWKLRSLKRLLAMVILAYALVLSGMLGAMASGAHIGQARLAAQLGVICTIHGIVDPASGRADGDDPSPGKLACVEHCTLASIIMSPAVMPVAGSPSVILDDRARTVWAWQDAAQHSTQRTTHPPPRGPPLFV